MRSLVASVCLLGGCISSDVEVPAPDYDDFRADVYPLLLRDCGFARCHGDGERFWAIWGPGRTRLDEADAPLGPLDPPSDREVWMSYQRTRAALSHDDDPLAAPLLQRPLEGHRHGGTDAWGHNLWTRDDPRWQLVARWAQGEPLDELEIDP